MKRGYIQEGVAAFFLATALANGAVAYHANEEVARANGLEQAYAAAGNQQMAAEWGAYSKDEEHGRNATLGFTIAELGIAATFSVLGCSSLRRQREEEEE